MGLKFSKNKTAPSPPLDCDFDPSKPPSSEESNAATIIQARIRGRNGRAVNKKILELFKKADINGDGQVTRKEVLQFLVTEENPDAVARTLQLPKAIGGGKKAVWIFKRKFERSFKKSDSQTGGVLKFHEFCAFLDEYKAQAAKARREARIQYAQDSSAGGSWLDTQRALEGDDQPTWGHHNFAGTIAYALKNQGEDAPKRRLDVLSSCDIIASRHGLASQVDKPDLAEFRSDLSM